MEWMISLAVLPLLLCAAMCVGGALVAVLGIRRRRRRPAPTDHGADWADELVERP